MGDDAQGKADLALPDKGMLGAIVMLCTHSRLHKQYTVGMIASRIAPSLALGQFRYYEDAEGRPVAFCNWALLTDALLARALAGDFSPSLEDWRSGGNLYFPEFIAPFGHCRMIVRDLRTAVVPAGARGWSTRGATDADAASIRVHRFVNT